MTISWTYQPKTPMPTVAVAIGQSIGLLLALTYAVPHGWSYAIKHN